MENRTHQDQIKKLEEWFLLAENQDNKGAATKKLLNEKENTIQLLKKKINILATQLIKASDLLDLEKEKEILNRKLIDFQAQLLKFIDK